MRRLVALCWTIFAFGWMPCCAAWGQSQGGTLAGVVRNEKQETLPGARIQLSLPSDNSQTLVAETTSDENGRFYFVGCAAGSYTLRVSLTPAGSQPSATTLTPAPANLEQVSTVEIREAGTVDVVIVLGASSDARDAGTRLFDRSIWWGSQFDRSALHDLPTTRRIWSLLENQETSTVTEHLDIGGLETGTFPRFSAVGASWTANQYLLNGLDVTDPYVPGSPLLDPDLGELSRIAAVTAAKPAMYASSGENLEMQTPQPSGELHGAVRWFYSGRWLQSDNESAQLTALGFPGPERLKQLGDLGVQLGGRLPVSRAPLPFIVSFSRQQTSKDLGGFAVPLVAHVSNGLAEFTPYERGTRQLNVLYSAQHVYDSRDDADIHTDPDATLRRNDNYRHLQTRWSNGLGELSELNAGIGLTQAILESSFQPDVMAASTIDLPLLTRTGSAPLATSGLRARYVANLGIHSIQPGPLGSHSLDFGATFNYGRITNRWYSRTGMDQVLVDGLGTEVVHWNTPTQTHQHVRDVSLYAQDSWRFLNSLVISWGLRVEDSSGHAEGGSGSVHWTTFEPRTGLAIPLGLHGLTVRASWSRYGEFLQGRYVDFGDPSALGGEVYAWNDTNGDRQAQPQEIGQLLRLFGGPHSALDPGLRRPFTDEITAGVDWPISHLLHARAGIFRRDVLRRVGVIDTDVPLSSYDPVSIFDAGDDPNNTIDDKTLTLYNQKASTLGQGNLLLTNPAGYGARSRGFELELSKPPSGRWGGSASFVAMETSAPTDPGNSALENDIGVIESFQTDPNSLLYATGVTYFDRGKFGRLHAYYRAPGGIWLGLVAKYYDGLPFARMLFISGFNQGPFFVRATPRLNVGGLLRTEFNATGDARISKQFKLSHGALTASVSVFNFMNSSNNTIEADLSGPTFIQRIPWAIQSPRITQLGLEWNY